MLSELLSARAGTVAARRHEPDPVPAPRPALPEAQDFLEVTVQGPADPVAMPLAQALPRNIAMLVVQRCGESAFKVLGFNERVRLRWDPSAPAFRQPGFSLARVVHSEHTEEVHEPRELFQLFREWSRGDFLELRRWVTLLRERVGEELHLWIADMTPFEIPWELLLLPPTGSQPGGFLGALLPVARWQKVVDPVRESGEAAECCGRGISYASPDLVEHMRGLPHVGRVGSLADLLGALRDDTADLALVYVTAYGHHSHHFTRVAISSRDGTDKLTLAQLTAPGELRVFEVANAVVFLNACHSGRPVDDPLLNSDYLRGFAEIFLQRGACGVIGTLGEVNIAFSAQLAAQLMAAFTTTSDGVPIAAALRDIRAAAAAHASDAEVPLEFAWAFMYVFYGHPLTRLRVVGDGEDEA